MIKLSLPAIMSITLIACSSGGDASASNGESAEKAAASDISPIDREPFERQEINSFNEPWAMTFLPSGMLLVTEKAGRLAFIDNPGTENQRLGWVTGVPEVAYGGQGGFGDVVPAPDFETSNMVYLSWAEEGEDGKKGAVVGRAKLVLDEADAGRLEGLKVIWKQTPKVKGSGHYSHRIAFSPDGKYLFIGSGERQKFDPSQDMTSNMGKIVRLFPDGTIPNDNPFIDEDNALPEIWSLGHRNILGIAFDENGKLWNSEMGPLHGDELNLVQRGSNYGYPFVSEGDHYDGKKIPDHSTRPEFDAPDVAWDPTIAPSGLIFYSGDMFPAWKGNAFIGGLASEAIVRVTFGEKGPKEAERFVMGARIREVEQGPGGALWVLEDGEGGRLLKLTPAK